MDEINDETVREPVDHVPDRPGQDERQGGPQQQRLRPALLKQLEEQHRRHHAGEQAQQDHPVNPETENVEGKVAEHAERRSRVFHVREIEAERQRL